MMPMYAVCIHTYDYIRYMILLLIIGMFSLGRQDSKTT